MDFEITKRVLAALERHGVRYAIFGAVALNLHGLARFTADLDLFIEPTAENVECLRPKISCVWNSAVTDIEDITKGEVTGVVLTDTVTGAVSEMAVDGVFIGIGHIPNRSLRRTKSAPRVDIT